MSRHRASGQISSSRGRQSTARHARLTWAALLLTTGIIALGIAPVHVAGTGGGGPTVARGIIEVDPDLAPAQLALEVVAPAEGIRLAWPWLDSLEPVPRAAMSVDGWHVGSDALVSRRAGARLDVAMATRCLLYTSPSPRDRTRSRMPSSA